MTFNMQKARAIAEKCQSRDDSVDHDYWNAHAGMFLPTALDEIERLQTTLVEERAYAIEYNPNRTIEWTHEQAKERAREQLHQEGKL